MRLPEKIALSAEIAVAYRQARRLMGTRDLPDTLAALRPQGPTANGAAPVGEAHRLAGATIRLLDAVPRADSRCLMRCLVLTRLLDRRRIPSTLVIGVQQPGEDFGAHAWVEVDGQAVLESGDFPRLVEL
jgi:hypothetical protein